MLQYVQPVLHGSGACDGPRLEMERQCVLGRKLLNLQSRRAVNEVLGRLTQTCMA